MIAGLKPYAEYTDSGLPWLGQVPAQWQIVRSKRLFAARKDLALPDDPQLSATQAYGVIEQAEFERRSGHRVVKISMHLDKRKHVEKDDFVISMRSFQGGIERAWASGAIRSSYVVLKPGPGVHASFFQYVLKSAGYIRALQATGDFIRDGQDLSFANFVRVDLPLVPMDEQAAIARFLDWANNRLERAIRAKRKVIALLLEQRQAIVRRAVTKGIDPAALLEPSDIPWLGDIPKHWSVRKMKSLVRTFGGMTPNKSVERYWVGRTPWISPKDMKVPEIFDSKDHISDAALKETGISVIADEAVLIVVRGMILARTFPTAITRVPVAINQDMKALVPRSELSVDYFALLLMGIQRELLELVEIAGHGTCCLRTDSWSAFCLPVPPLKEQGAIRRFLADELAVSAAAISRLEREINLLREYRTCLVTDVVTGKLDIREAAARLPDEVGPGLETEMTEESDDPEFIDEETEA